MFFDCELVVLIHIMRKNEDTILNFISYIIVPILIIVIRRISHKIQFKLNNSWYYDG